MTSKYDLADGMIFYSEFQQLMNDSTATNIFTIPSSSYTPGQGKSFSMTVPITSAKNLSQTTVNFSTSPTIWRNVPFSGNVTIGTGWSIQAMQQISGSSMTISFIIANQDPSTRNSPAVTVSAVVDTFVAPF